MVLYIYKILYTQTSLYNFNDSPWLDKGSLKKRIPNQLMVSCFTCVFLFPGSEQAFLEQRSMESDAMFVNKRQRFAVINQRTRVFIHNPWSYGGWSPILTTGGALTMTEEHSSATVNTWTSYSDRTLCTIRIQCHTAHAPTLSFS